ncbi:MAG: hypothetical protein WD071_07065 [Pseudohongiella sp.]|uniref:hypothetical protein n=1 Tax=Pseudohongiella sp. TaxID=1979412 RepID=UPI0034A099AC
MRFFKRNSNPIFIEEEQYNWRGERSLGLRFLVLVVITVIVAAGVMVLMNQ